MLSKNMLRFIKMYLRRFLRFKKNYYKIGLYSIILSMMFGPIAIPIAGRTPNLFWSDIAVLIVLIFGTLNFLLKGHPRKLIIPKIFLWLLLYIGLIGCSLLIAIDKLES